jgi:hypothetical protein
MKKLYIKLAVFGFLFMVILKGIDGFVVHSPSFSANYRNFFQKEKRYDYVYLGNSLSQRMFDIKEIDSVLDVQSINLGSSAQHFYITHAIFEELVKKEALHPDKLLMVGVSPWQFKPFTKKRLKYLQMQAIDELEFSANYVEILARMYHINEYPTVVSPTIRFHSDLSENIKTTPSKLEASLKSNGKGFDYNVTRRLSKELRESKKDLREVAVAYNASIDDAISESIGDREEEMLVDMIKACKENNIPVLFYIAPAINMLYEKHDHGKVKFLEELFKSNQVNYINFNRIFNDLKLTTNDFSDYSHLNKYGNKKTNTIFFDSIFPMSDVSKR